MNKPTSLPAESRARGFTYLELVFVIVILSLLYIFGIDKLLKLRVDAEATGLAYAISGLQVALSLQMSEMVARGEMHKLPVLVGQNPMDWLLVVQAVEEEITLPVMPNIFVILTAVV